MSDANLTSAKKDLYNTLGVDAHKADVHGAVKQLDAGVIPSGFCRVQRDPSDLSQLVVFHSDGLGTKPTIAYLAWRNDQNLQWFSGLGTDAIVMNTDDMLCVGATGPFLLTNVIERNKGRIDGAVIKAIIGSYAKAIDDFKKDSVQITHCGGETEDLGVAVQTLTASCSLFAKVNDEQLIDNGNIQPGDSIVGVASDFGPGLEPGKQNSGIGCNGLTLARHALLDSSYAEEFPEAFDAAAPKPVGKFRLADKLPQTDYSIANGLLSPTNSYLPHLQKVLKDYRPSGMVHCTGGGLTKCLHFGQNLHFIKEDLLPVPPVFSAIQNSAEVSNSEMYKVFNMGCRLEIYCRPGTEKVYIEALRHAHIPARIIGRVEHSPTGNTLTLRTKSEDLHYDSES